MSRALTSAMRAALESAAAHSRGKVTAPGRSRRALLDRGLIADHGGDFCVFTDAGRAAVAPRAHSPVTYNPCMPRAERARVEPAPKARTLRDDWESVSTWAIADAREWLDRTALGTITTLELRGVIRDLVEALEDPLHATSVKTEEEYDAAIAEERSGIGDLEKRASDAERERAEANIAREVAEGKLEQALVDLGESRDAHLRVCVALKVALDMLAEEVVLDPLRTALTREIEQLRGHLR